MGVTCPKCQREFPNGAPVCTFDGTRLLRAEDWEEETAPRDQAAIAAALETTEIPSLAGGGSLTGMKLGDYVAGERIGAGGMGEVYAGEQPVIGKKVAIKVLKLEIATDQESVRRMLAEARAVSAIRHRAIVDIFTFGTLPDGRPYLVMEYLVGESLDAFLHRHGPLSPVDVISLLDEICDALSAAHAANVIHRDLKPGNVFLVNPESRTGRYVKLLDFGLAKSKRVETSSSGPLTRTGMVVGTPDYIAPEQARGAEVTGQTDLYSLGVMAFELLTGKLPFSAESIVELMMHHLKTAAPRVSSILAGVPPPLEDLVARLLSKTAEARPASAEAVRRELKRMRRDMSEDRTQLKAPLPSAPRASRPPRPVHREVEGVPADSQRTPIEPPSPGSALQPTPMDLPRAPASTQTLRVSPRAWRFPAGVAVAAATALGVWWWTSGSSENVTELPSVAPALVAQPEVPTAVAPADPSPPQPSPSAPSVRTPRPMAAPSTEPIPVAPRPVEPTRPAVRRTTSAPRPPPVVAVAPAPPSAPAAPSALELKQQIDRLEVAPPARVSPKLVQTIIASFNSELDRAKTEQDRVQLEKKIREFAQSR